MSGVQPSGYGVSPQSAFVGGCVGFFFDGLRGGAKGVLVGSLVSLTVNYFKHR